MILIGQFDSPYVRRVAVSLNVLGIAFERRLLSVFRHAEDLRRYNPLGRVPALAIEDGSVLIDSAAILDYLDELVGPDRALLPPGGALRRDALRSMAIATGCSDKAMAIAYERRREQSLIDATWIARSRTQLDAGLAALEQAIRWQPDERLMQPAITTATMLGYVRLRVPEALSGGRYPNLDGLAERCEALPAFAASLPTVEEIGGPDAPAALTRLRQVARG
ncbi:MAG TPA: glutathione S-transferase family protein [Xanthobacteraceae bacterium]|nr:glutathione S-transferase family protein [Xanthobacteraceae bacterium]